MDSLHWMRYFMNSAKLISRQSKDPSTKVGAVLVRDKHIVGHGLNGFPSGIADDDRLTLRTEKYELIIHAEMNALLDAGKDARGCTLFLYGFRSAPCRNCSKHLIQAGIKSVVACGPELPVRWIEPVRRAEETLNEADILVTIMDESKLEYPGEKE